MTDHFSIANKRVQKAQQDADDVNRVVLAVGDELASAADIIYSRIWEGTIGGLGYKLPAAEVQALMDRLPPEPLEYRLPRNWAGQVKPRSLPLDRYEDQLRQRQAASPFYAKAWCVAYHTTVDVVWYTSSHQGNGMLIRVEAALTDADRWATFRTEILRDGHGHAYDWKPFVSHNFQYAQTSVAGPIKGGTSTAPEFAQYTYWWEEGFTFAEVIQR